MKQKERGKINFNFRNKKLKNGFTITISIIAILAIIYFISEEFFYEVTSLILTILIIGLPILIIISPFIFISRKFKKFTKKNVSIAIIISLIMLIIIAVLYYYLIIWAIGEISRAFLSTF